MIQEQAVNSEIQCPACNSTRGSALGAKHHFPLRQCGDCRSVYLAEALPTERTLDYDDYYDEHNLSVPAFIKHRQQEIVTGFAPYRSMNRLLDVGFGAGNLLLEAKMQQWEVSGVEVSKPAVEQARQWGADVFLGELAEAGYPDNSFDVVCASEILEHLVDPRSLIQEVARILRPGGLFWATTPHAGGLSYRLLGLNWTVVCPPEHVCLLTYKGLKNLLSEAGFRQINLRLEGLNPFEILQHFGLLTQQSQANNSLTNSRVSSSYALNEKLLQSPWRRALKTTLNGMLHYSTLGDSLKIAATR